ncbi:hypothetical protein [Halogeometricum limi]|uniref:Ribosomal protein S6--L-glutamate ligase n=1 Tax=Halogeometricum limi TaxID=555875 RepID=A0A1I6G143_9EURY|nr:hypothetical protein [Halogeometricum limi]SFR35896.1 hypothetical protein SAMN04488124_0694 [Halogeometricum limi]
MSTAPRPRIGITYKKRHGNPVKYRLFERLRSWADVVVLDHRRRHPDLPEMELDLYHMAGWSPAAFADFEVAREAGIPTVNSYAGAVQTEDRLLAARACVDAGLPFVPFEYGRADEITLKPPVVVKPRHELEPGGHRLDVVFSGALRFEGERLVERYVVPARSFKVFGVGSEIRASERHSRTDAWEEVRVPGRFVELAAEVSTLFDLSVFELDVVVHKSYYVIDVNPVVSLDGVEDAVEVYETVLRRACEDARRRHRYGR